MKYLFEETIIVTREQLVEGRNLVDARHNLIQGRILQSSLVSKECTQSVLLEVIK